MARTRHEKPDACAVLPLHPRVRIFCDGRVNGYGQVSIHYDGPTEALIGAGVATAAMLSGSQPGRPRRDVNGNRFHITRTFRLEAGSPRPYCKIVISRPAHLVDQLPGVRQAIDSSRRVLKWYENRRRLASPEPTPVAILRVRPRLRLVVDNTRPA
jgi:hypothetical protein